MAYCCACAVGAVSSRMLGYLLLLSVYVALAVSVIGALRVGLVA